MRDVRLSQAWSNIAPFAMGKFCTLCEKAACMPQHMQANLHTCRKLSEPYLCMCACADHKARQFEKLENLLPKKNVHAFKSYGHKQTQIIIELRNNILYQPYAIIFTQILNNLLPGARANPSELDKNEGRRKGISFVSIKTQIWLSIQVHGTCNALRFCAICYLSWPKLGPDGPKFAWALMEESVLLN